MMEGGRKRVLTLKIHYSISSPDLKGQNIKGVNDYQHSPYTNALELAGML
ncbi:hypothetical protein PMIT1313_00863 [Prochlorococcus marinus str. MIT 1313]|nr:hypothetical protein PMIT1313_00863 [Prochlorococcus marinus str. MIT 1313]KZR72107.1 hypothetical protein PMIT1318_01163 [Prochlorococcus marinus str. MIT 1318]